MQSAFCDWEFGGWIEGKAHREFVDCVTTKLLFAKMLFLVQLILIVLFSEVFGFCAGGASASG